MRCAAVRPRRSPPRTHRRQKSIHVVVRNRVIAGLAVARAAICCTRWSTSGRASRRSRLCPAAASVAHASVALASTTTSSTSCAAGKLAAAVRAKRSSKQPSTRHTTRSSGSGQAAATTTRNANTRHHSITNRIMRARSAAVEGTAGCLVIRIYGNRTDVMIDRVGVCVFARRTPLCVC